MNNEPDVSKVVIPDGWKLVIKDGFIAFIKREDEPLYNHYVKDVRHLALLDMYQLTDLYGVDDKTGCVHHAVKKLLCSGNRGVKGIHTDLTESIMTILRKLEIDGKVVKKNIGEHELRLTFIDPIRKLSKEVESQS